MRIFLFKGTMEASKCVNSKEYVTYNIPTLLHGVVATLFVVSG